MFRFLSEKIEKIKIRKQILDELNDFFKIKYLNGEIDFDCKVRLTVWGQADSAVDGKVFPFSIEFRASGYMSQKNIEIFKNLIIQNYINDSSFLRKLKYLNISYVTCTFNDKFSTWDV